MRLIRIYFGALCEHPQPCPPRAPCVPPLGRLLLLLLVVAASSAHAAQPLATDDAAVVAPKSCQLEVWNRSAHGARTFWAQPARNFTGNLELSFGGARAQPDAGESSSIVALQAKTVLVASESGTSSFGMLAGAGRGKHLWIRNVRARRRSRSMRHRLQRAVVGRSLSRRTSRRQVPGRRTIHLRP